MEERHLEIKKSIRYYLDGKGETLWYVLHGYGQHPKFFLRKFQNVVNLGNIVVAPEGLHRYYLNGNSGRVGASWMTKEDRETDIRDYINYLTLLDSKLSEECTPKRKVLLGFSQGVATAVRWLLSENVKFDRVILWSGTFPPDVNFPSAKEILKDPIPELVIGDKDEFIGENELIQMTDFLKDQGIPFHLTSFEGGHDIDTKTLNKLLDSNK